MSTERVYREDAYAVAVMAKVTGVRPGKDFADYVFDRTVFFPEGGGQPSDTGAVTLSDGTSYDVSWAYETSQDGDVFHRVPFAGGAAPALAVGDTVVVEIDPEERFINMQRHSGEHILSGAFYNTFGGANKGFHMGKDFITIDIDMGGRILTREEVAEAELAANRAIWDDLPFSTVYYANADEANKAPVRKHVDLEGEVSVVFVGDPEAPFDCVACCGTHVQSAGEIGLIKIYKTEVNKGMNRIYFDCGSRAFDRVCEEIDILTELANRYSTSKENLLHKVDVEAERSKALRETLSSLTAFYREQRSAEFARLWSEAGGAVHIAADELDPDDLLKFAFACIEKVAPSDALAVVTHQGSRTAILVSSGSSYDCGKLVKEHAFACGGKGGGRKDNARAVFPGVKEMLKFVSLLV